MFQLKMKTINNVWSCGSWGTWFVEAGCNISTLKNNAELRNLYGCINPTLVRCSHTWKVSLYVITLIVLLCALFHECLYGLKKKSY